MEACLPESSKKFKGEENKESTASQSPRLLITLECIISYLYKAFSQCISLKLNMFSHFKGLIRSRFNTFLKPTYHFGFFFCERFTQICFLHSQCVSGREDGACNWHGGFTIFLLQAISYDQECPQTDVHSLEESVFRTQRQTQLL